MRVFERSKLGLRSSEFASVPVKKESTVRSQDQFSLTSGASGTAAKSVKSRRVLGRRMVLLGQQVRQAALKALGASLMIGGMAACTGDQSDANQQATTKPSSLPPSPHTLVVELPEKKQEAPSLERLMARELLLEPEVVELSKSSAELALNGVQSLRTQYLQESLATAQNQLGKAQQRRYEAIEGILPGMSGNNRTVLERDLAKTIDEILVEPDCKLVYGPLRNDVKHWHGKVQSLEKRLAASEDTWHQYDSLFFRPKVTEALSMANIKPSQLKALMGQESGDFTITDTKGDIQGLAQAGSKEAKAASWGDSLDRSKAADAVLIGARVLVAKTKDLAWELEQRDMSWSNFKDSTDYSKLIYASYNAGAQPIARAMQITKERGLNPGSWHDLTQVSAGAKSSPLKAALSEVRLYRNAPGAKYHEVTTYVERIESRLQGTGAARLPIN